MSARDLARAPRLAVSIGFAFLSLALAAASVLLHVLSFISGPSDDVDPPAFRSTALKLFVFAFLSGLVALVAVLTGRPRDENGDGDAS